MTTKMNRDHTIDLLQKCFDELAIFPYLTTTPDKVNLLQTILNILVSYPRPSKEGDDTEAHPSTVGAYLLVCNARNTIRVQFSDSLIINMNSILNQLDNSEYVIYTTEDDIPIIKSFAGIRYNLSTNIKADYYYLLATDSEEELNEFIKEVSLNDFEMGETNMRNSVSCFRANEKGGYLTIFFIGLNKDWSKHIVPIGMVAIDNIKPSVLSDNSSVEAFLSSNSKNAQFEDLILYSKGIRIAMPNKYPKISGQIYISTNSFRGNHANFEFGLFENGDIESISIKREVHRDYMKRVMKPETKTIKLSDKKSPYHFTYELDLGIGDNYIPITVTDKRGNKTNYTYKISMVQVEDNDPDINIDNNINIY